MMFILEKIEMFPFWLFTPNTRDYVFWRSIKISLIETTLMITSRSILDKRKDVLTLKNLRDATIMYAIDESARQVIEDRLGSVDFDTRVKAIEAKVISIRHNFLAHLNRIQNTLEPDRRTIETITFGEMKELMNAAFDLFNTLSFEVAYVFWWSDYRDEVRNANQTDIDRLLDSVAKNSALLNLPESNPVVWSRRCMTLTEKELEILNQYRKKFGLPQVD